MLETRRQTEARPRRPSNAVRSAEGRRVPFAKGKGDAHVGGDAPPGVLGTGRHSALRPLGFAEGTKTRRPGGKHDGQPRGRATPRTISHGCMTS